MPALSRALPLVALAALVAAVPALAHHGDAPPNSAAKPVDAACDHFWPNDDPAVVLTDIVVGTEAGEQVHGCLAHPTTGSPTDLVVFVHGSGHTVQNAWAHHMVEVAQHGAVAVGVNFRDNFGFPTMWGAEDTIHATLDALDRFPSIERTILFGTSMGGAISGTAISEAPRFTGGGGLYDIWIDVEGVSNVTETWAEATAIGHPAGPGIERDAGGRPHEVPAEYARRSPVTRGADMAAAGLEQAILVHAPFDGLVAYWQGQSMNAALRGAGIPTRFTTVARGSGSYDDSTAFDLFSPQLEQANQSTVDLAGHAWEGDRDHPVNEAAFGHLITLLAGGDVAPGDDVVSTGT